jgi:hypothetical protein
LRTKESSHGHPAAHAQTGLAPTTLHVALGLVRSSQTAHCLEITLPSRVARPTLTSNGEGEAAQKRPMRVPEVAEAPINGYCYGSPSGRAIMIQSLTGQDLMLD